jgi:hypothetical protein
VRISPPSLVGTNLSPYSREYFSAGDSDLALLSLDIPLESRDGVSEVEAMPKIGLTRGLFLLGASSSASC